MDNRAKGLEKALLVLGIVVALVGLGFLIGPRIGGLQDIIHGGDVMNAESLTYTLVRAVENDRPNRVWNVVHTNFRKMFIGYFDKVRRGEVPIEAWLEAARNSGEAVSTDQLRGLDDRAMFRVWWHLRNRDVVGFRLPLFLKLKGPDIDSVILKNYFYEKSPAEAARFAYLLCQVNEAADLVYFSKDSGRWSLDFLKEVPVGM